MIDNPSTYEPLKQRILHDFKKQFPHIKIKTHNAWKGITEWKGKNCDVTIPDSSGPTAIKILLHEISHCVMGPIRPIALGEYKADQMALKMMKKYGVPITDRTLQRIYSYIVKKLDQALRGGIQKVPQELKPFLSDVAYKREYGGVMWRAQVRDRNLNKLLQLMEV